jgi:UrcA family protein
LETYVTNTLADNLLKNNKYQFLSALGMIPAKHGTSEAGWSGRSARQRRNTMLTTSTNTFRNVLGTIGTVICAGVCLVAATAPAQAAEAPRATTVSYVDLNLANDQGRDTLDARIKAAARSVCANSGGDLRARTGQARCIREAISQARMTAFSHGFQSR